MLGDKSEDTNCSEIYENIETTRSIKIKGVKNPDLTILKYFPDLLLLSIIDSDLEVIELNGRNLSKLESLILYQNKIKSVKLDLPLLEYADLSSNKISNSEDINVSKSLNLFMLNIGKNSLETLPKLPKNLKYLGIIELNLDFNKFTAKSFNDLVNLEYFGVKDAEVGDFLTERLSVKSIMLKFTYNVFKSVTGKSENYPAD